MIRMAPSSSAPPQISACGTPMQQRPPSPPRFAYSMNHANVAGALNIWGAYTRSSGSDYWDYATDFDGTALGDLRARSPSPSHRHPRSHSPADSSTLSAPERDDLHCHTGKRHVLFLGLRRNLNASYYRVSSTTAAASTSQAVRRSRPWATASSISSRAEPRSPSLRASSTRTRSSRSSTTDSRPRPVSRRGLTSPKSAHRVHTGGSAVAYGPLQGEAYDNDPGGNPGYIRWDNSGYNITVSGNVYSDEGAR